MPRKWDEGGKIKGEEKGGGGGENRQRPKRRKRKIYGLNLWIK